MPVDPFTFVLLTLATYRLTRLFLLDEIFSPLREFIWKKFPPHTKLGYLFTCFWCFGLWASILVVVLYLLVPTFAYVVSLVLSISALVGIVSSRMD
jgi:hypothetical protein